MIKGLEEIKRASLARPEELRQGSLMGRIPIGYFCNYVPEEMIHAAGLNPIRLVLGGEKEPEISGGEYITPNSCSYAKSCIGYRASGKNPFFMITNHIVESPACVQMEWVLESLEKYFGIQAIPIGLPRKFEGKEALTYYLRELEDFRARIEKIAARKITDEDLQKSISLYNSIRQKLRAIYDFLKEENPPLSWGEALEIVQAGFVLDRQKYLEILDPILEELATLREIGDENKKGPRLLITGSILASGDRKILDLAKELGAKIVIDELCTGSRWFWNDVEEPTLEGLGRRYLKKIPCANPTDIYYGCGVIPVDPFFISMAHLIYKGDYSLATEGREQLSPDACAWQAVGNAAIRRNLFPVDAYYTFVGPWCTNSPYNGENLSDVISEVHFVDQPFFPHLRGKEDNALEYMVGELQTFVKTTERLTKKKVDKTDLLESIRFHNRMRKKIRALMDFLLVEPPPISALDFILTMVLVDDWQSDPLAANDTLDTVLMEIGERAKKGIKGPGISDDAVRIFFSGITTSEIKIYNLLEDLGGTLAGLECVWNLLRADVNEDEDPYTALAKRDLSIPFTQPMEQRAKVVTGLTKQMKADGSIFDCAFGCNYIAKTARCVTNNIRMELNIPTTIIDTDLPGENRAALEEHLEGFLEIVRESKEAKGLRKS